MIAEDIINALRSRHSAEEIFVTELRGGSGGRSTDNSYIDAWAMHPYPSKQNCRVAYEVKVSRGDFLRDIKQPHKHRAALVHSNEFYFAAPEGMLRAEEMPLFAGLLEVKTMEHGPRKGEPYIGYPSLQAPWRDTNPPSWRFVASLCRSVRKATR